MPTPNRKSKKNNRYHRAARVTPSWLKRSGIYLGLIAAFLSACYVGYLDYTVREQFEGKRWSIPARVYANPVELYVGYPMSAKELEELLLDLHYRLDPKLEAEGSYAMRGGRINVRSRAFNFGGEEQPSKAFSVAFDGTTVIGLSDLLHDDDLAIVRMDPIQIGSFYPTRKEDRILIKLDETPELLVKGLFATEDRDFYNHFGLSPKSILRATWANIRAGGVVQGGSTITQQLVKNFYLSSERSVVRKINEALMALILEYRYSKDEILEAYLNEIYLGQDGGSAVHGFGLASEFYFGQSLKNLSVPQLATLVALVRGPSYYDPRKHPERTVERRNLVLDAMVIEEYLPSEQAEKAKKESLNVVSMTHRSANRHPGFMDLVKRQLQQEYKEEDLTSEGLRIFTTLDERIQTVLERAVAAKLKQLEKSPKSDDLESAAIVTRRDTGEIVALTSGRENTATGFNRALDAVRPIGSLIKPVVYLTALEYPNKYTITTPVSDTHIELEAEKGKSWEPKNYDNQQHGVVPLHTALAQSYNLATVRIGMDVGIARTAKTLRSMGVSRPVDLFPSFLLGASPLTPLEVTQMYQTLAGDGFATPLRSIHSVIAADGKKLQSYPYNVQQTLDPAATFITNKILQEVMYKGTGRAAYASIPSDMGLVGKTGTTNKLRDSWFAGFSGDYLSVVWVGRDDNQPTGLTGATGALQVWIDLMKQVARKPVALVQPDNVEMKWVDVDSGLLSDKDCPNAAAMPYVKGSAPTADAGCGPSSEEDGQSWLNNFLPSDQ